ncbi:MAG: glucose-6-phosphate dehydrogenase [Zetaproteobacteria bacterium CG12_big_fil_rev_8_21_14_0_65_55_1124]|nr:MAG: glucose-6-phosphate dehydrogenase [Zetaproteobacteria bacterium CG1_02_55_237]PIS19047.1 MAG: glucose-6-phosphate dehydrogenase [Zetaproteobacteria bacterium CG08_land_8_20_14_0_20_55_17]PIW41828.1 MAG: glucose-6-phosphate dehydrogenase [Zetaproteobacteria bacterium CG12_big_fil_rev_8_21_14_0_65_55_1124]PIY54064.1 MAG: glucose-6-phosphate dehydrogenase [Zetaproteobacteria bacterium CG_4_10_14_0_8_um_filter_55_43]PIZ40239.1 MAG: glucose-6-phosphate dehydrogenase [Zetaproteobacteria bacte
MNDQMAQEHFSDLAAAMHLREDAADPCIMVIFGASGDLTKRLLVPSLFNLYCDDLLPPSFAILGMAMDDFTTDSFRAKMDADIREFSKRSPFDEQAWHTFCLGIHYIQGRFDDAQAFSLLQEKLGEMDAEYATGGNVLFYMATPPAVFSMLSSHIEAVGLNRDSDGWRRIIVEKPFGTDLASAIALNREILSYWKEEQVYRIDHYIGKEAVQNLLAFRFANGMFEPLWNRTHIDHIQITATEQVGVEWRGAYYEKSGVMRDMIQNHLFQMMAYLCMEPPTSFEADAIRNEKFKLLSAVRLMSSDDVALNAVRGQYAEGVKPDGSPAVAYRDEAHINPHSNTETFAALKVRIDNWRWHGVPVYLRSGKAMESKTTEIVVQFRRAPEFTFRGTPAFGQLEANQLIFRIHPEEGIELRFLAKRPGPSMHMRKVNMHFAYDEAFTRQPGTGYETMLYDCMHGDSSLFSRTDLVETSWRIVQPVLDVWGEEKAVDFPNYPFGSWGPKASFELLNPGHRRWVDRISRTVLERVPMFEGSSDAMLKAFAMMLKPMVFNRGDEIVQYGSEGGELFIIEKGRVEIVDRKGWVKTELGEGQVFGEVSLLITKQRQASVRALTYCVIYTLEKRDFCKVLKDKPQFAERVMQMARERYNVIIDANDLMADGMPSSKPD